MSPRSALVVLGSLLLATLARADTLDDRVLTVARALMADQQLPGLAVGVVAPGVRRLYYLGLADQARGRPVQVRTLFELGSLSKTYAATLGAYAEATGRLRLSEPLAQARPDLADAPLGRATLLQLVTYQAGGLPLQFPEAVERAGTAAAFYRAFTPPFAPGTQRLYSNPSLGLFAALVGQRLDGTYAKSLARRVLTPLGLADTFVEVPPNRQDDYAWGYRDGHPVRVTLGVYGAEAYGLKSTAGDLLVFVAAHLAPAALPPPLTEALRATPRPRYRSGPWVQGLGWEGYPWPVSLATLQAGNAPAMALHPQPVQPAPAAAGPYLWNKTGSTHGFGAYAAFVPAEGLGVVLLANRNYPNAARVAAAHALLQHLAAARPQSARWMPRPWRPGANSGLSVNAGIW